MSHIQQATNGIVLHSPRLYDFTVWFATGGRENKFREMLLSLARVRKGDVILDVGCGTGTLAIAAKQQVGTTGMVFGIDASREMLARADQKARKACQVISFQSAVAEALPFPDGHFDLVCSVAMLHHLPQESRIQCASEIRRVLKPDGRLLAVDFEGFSHGKRTVLSHLRRPHGEVMANDIAALLRDVGLRVQESGAVGLRGMWYILATPC